MYEHQHTTFKDPGAQTLKKNQFFSAFPIALVPVISSSAVPNGYVAWEVYPSDIYVSKPEDWVGASAIVVSLVVGWNQWCEDCVFIWLILKEAHWALAEAVCNPLFTGTSAVSLQIGARYGWLCFFFSRKLLFWRMVKHTDANILVDDEHVTELEMNHFVWIMFPMTVCPMSKIKDHWTLADDHLFLASWFQEKLDPLGGPGSFYTLCCL